MDIFDAAQWKAQWSILTNAPYIVVPVMAAVAAAAWWLRGWIASGAVDGLREQNKALEERLKSAEAHTKKGTSESTPPSFPLKPEPAWDAPLEKRFRFHYKNETVDVDGFEFIECTFENVTFRYQGRRPFRFHKTKGDSKKLTTDNPVVGTTVILLTAIRGEHLADYDIYPTGSR